MTKYIILCYYSFTYINNKNIMIKSKENKSSWNKNSRTIKKPINSRRERYCDMRDILSNIY